MGTSDASTVVNELSEVDRLKQDLRREQEMHLRTLADFENYRRRVDRDREALSKSGKREVLFALLEVLDGFEGALEHVDSAPSYLAGGLEAIYRKLLGLLESQGVVPCESLGQPFDPRLHEAIGGLKSDTYPPGVVMEELQRGYRWDSEILRPARVRVAQEE